MQTPESEPVNEGSPLDPKRKRNRNYSVNCAIATMTNENDENYGHEDEHNPLHGKEKSDDQSNLMLLVTVAGATAATLGYDVGIMAAAIQPLVAQMGLNGFQKEVAMGSLNFVAAVGGFIGGHVGDKYGRKKTISLCCWFFVVGTILMAMAWNYSALLAGRIITGLGVGVAFVAAPSYISEVAPTDARGQLNTIFDIRCVPSVQKATVEFLN